MGSLRAPILVTGMHRSGTTWVGRMLAASREAVYLHEPLNPVSAPALLRMELAAQYPYVTEENEEEYLESYRRLLAFPLAAHRAEGSRRKRLRRLVRLLHARLTDARALLKDPFAVFSIPWFARRLGAQVVVIVRDPLAIAGSTARLGWGFDTRSLLGQPLLMRDRLEQFRGELEAPPTNIVGQIALLWRIVYQVVGDYARELPEIRVVRHEDLSREPLQEFERLYDALGLSFGRRTVRALERTTSPENPSQIAVTEPDSIEVDSRANLEAWRTRLTPEEVELVRRETEPVAGRFYE